jgi:hypothetical protein
MVAVACPDSKWSRSCAPAKLKPNPTNRPRGHVGQVGQVPRAPTLPKLLPHARHMPRHALERGSWLTKRFHMPTPWWGGGHAWAQGLHIHVLHHHAKCTTLPPLSGLGPPCQDALRSAHARPGNRLPRCGAGGCLGVGACGTTGELPKPWGPRF